MPDFPVVDTHLHLWDPHGEVIRYPWLDGEPALNRRFGLQEFKAACGPIQVERMVFLQCDPRPEDNIKEVEWVTGLAKGDPRIQAIVAGARIERGETVEAHLKTLASFPLVRGVRRILQAEEDPDFCLREEFLDGIRLLARFGFSFDICIKHHQVRSVTRLVERVPDVSFVLDHMGKPNIREQVMEPWATDIRALSSFPNVWCKVSGLVTEADHVLWRRDQLKPYIDHVVECFGFERVMYGGDWPVSTQAADYPEWVRALDWAVEGCSDGELEALYKENAKRFYRLKD